jgi:hypothetical protein
MPLDLKTLHRGDRVRLLREISGYAAGTIGTVGEVSSERGLATRLTPCIAVDWPTPTERFGPDAKPTRDWVNQEEQDRFGFLEQAAE